MTVFTFINVNVHTQDKIFYCVVLVFAFGGFTLDYVFCLSHAFGGFTQVYVFTQQIMCMCKTCSIYRQVYVLDQHVPFMLLCY